MRRQLAGMLAGLFVPAAVGACSAFAADFSVSASMVARPDGAALAVTFEFPEGHLLYADRVEVEVTAPAGVKAVPLDIPPATVKPDPFGDGTVAVHDHAFTALYGLPGLDSASVDVTVRYQGCSRDTCFLPAEKTFHLDAANRSASESAPDRPAVDAAAGHTDPGQDLVHLVDGLEVAGAEVGYLNAADFLEFLDRTETGTRRTGLTAVVREGNIWMAILLIFVLGIGLNLTPCVLPMIPVNLAIIGGGAHATSRRRGLAMGTGYGLGMMAAYGALGAFVVVTGAAFGTLNASPWFNFGIAAIFLALALAMFGALTVDFSKFTPATTRPGSRSPAGSLLTAVSMGAVAALLAGACVAPVVLATLVRAGNLYGAGNRWALFLPFVLGAGMALPWPLAGAGLSLLPKPGRWMNGVKYAFGAVILLMALYYGRQGLRLMRTTPVAGRHAESAGAIGPTEGWEVAPATAVARARSEGKPLLIDFWATWCKNCMAMEKTTFQDARVLERFEGYVTLKVQAEKPDQPAMRRVLRHFGVRGLPTYVILREGSQPEARKGAADEPRTAL